MSKSLIIKGLDNQVQLSVWLSNALIIKPKNPLIKSINTQKKAWYHSLYSIQSSRPKCWSTYMTWTNHYPVFLHMMSTRFACSTKKPFLTFSFSSFFFFCLISAWMLLHVKAVWILIRVRSVGGMCKWNPTSCVRVQKWFTEMNPRWFTRFGSLCESD